MRKGKLWPILLTAAAILLALVAFDLESREKLTVSAEIRHQGREETLTCWQSSWDTAYIFLPGYAQLDEVRLRVPKDNVFWIDGRPVTDGMTCEGFEPDRKYALEISEEAGLSAERIVFLQSAGVATLYVDVSSGDMEYLHKDKQHSEPGSARLYDENGDLCYSGRLDSVSGRGQSTWELEKKSYNIRLAQPADLLDMGTAENWVLQANGNDYSNLRNTLVFQCAREAGLAYAPDCRWTDLYLNGEYAGLYLLCERIEVHPERVDIPQTGSALLTKDWEWRFRDQGEPYVFTRNNVALGIRYSDLEQETLESVLQSVENALLAEDGVDPVTGKSWQDLIDVDSWVKKYLIEEIFANRDGLSLSQYFYLDGSREDGRLMAGPVWDYDLTMAKVADQYYINRQGVYGSSWWPALFHRTEFYEQVRREYAAVFRPLVQQILDSQLDLLSEKISAASYMNAQKWGVLSAGEDTEKIRTYMTQRLAFLDRLWIDEPGSAVVQAFDRKGNLQVYALEAGSLLPQLPEHGSSQWYYEGKKEPVDPARPVYENIRLYQIEDRAEEKPLLPPAPVTDAEAEAEELSEPIPFRQWAPGAALLLLMAAVLTADRILSGSGEIRRKQKSKTGI